MRRPRLEATKALGLMNIQAETKRDIFYTIGLPCVIKTRNLIIADMAIDRCNALHESGCR